jgi:hypothetical protein
MPALVTGGAVIGPAEDFGVQTLTADKLCL